MRRKHKRIIKQTIVSFSCKCYRSGLDKPRDDQEGRATNPELESGTRGPLSLLVTCGWRTVVFSTLCYSWATKLASYVLYPTETGMYLRTRILLFHCNSLNCEFFLNLYIGAEASGLKSIIIACFYPSLYRDQNACSGSKQIIKIELKKLAKKAWLHLGEIWAVKGNDKLLLWGSEILQEG